MYIYIYPEVTITLRLIVELQKSATQKGVVSGEKFVQTTYNKVKNTSKSNNF